MSVTDHEHSETIREAALWLATTPDHAKPRPIIPELRKRFGLSAREACAAISEACLIRGGVQ